MVDQIYPYLFLFTQVTLLGGNQWTKMFLGTYYAVFWPQLYFF